MNSKFSFLKKIPVFLISAGALLLVTLSFWPRALPHGKHGEYSSSGRILNRWSLNDLIEIYGQAWLSVQAKVDALRHTQEDNAKLRQDNAKLRLGLETLKLGCHADIAAHTTKDYEKRLSKETGTIAGRVLAGINYKAPSSLIPSQLYTLGISYLKAHEDEKAAVIFTDLTGLQDTDAFKTPKNYLITGVAWYRLDNLTLADYYFDLVLKGSETRESIGPQAQARLWKALIAKRLNKEVKTQYWLNELIDHHPHSTEAAWVNLPKQ